MKYFILKDNNKSHKIMYYSIPSPNSIAIQKDDELEKDFVLSMSNKEYYTSWQYHYLENLIPLTLIGVN